MLAPANVAQRQDGLMQRSPESLERRLSELAELFGPEQAAYGESYRERLREDDELAARVVSGSSVARLLASSPPCPTFYPTCRPKRKKNFSRPGA